jgi:orotidine-5'-phosphate decarboxylase
MPHSLFLVPGFGAQGASAADALAGFVRGTGGLEGGVVNASRAALYPPGAQAAINLPAWRETVASSIKTLAQELKQEAQ